MVPRVPDSVSAALAAVIDPSKSDAADADVYRRLAGAILEHPAPCVRDDSAPFLYNPGALGEAVGFAFMYCTKRLMRALSSSDDAVRRACAAQLAMLLRDLKAGILGSTAVTDEVLSSWCAAALAASDDKFCALTHAQEVCRRRGIVVGCRILLDAGCVVAPVLLAAVLGVWRDTDVLALDCVLLVAAVVDAHVNVSPSASESAARSDRPMLKAPAAGFIPVALASVLEEASAFKDLSQARQAALALAAWSVPVGRVLGDAAASDATATAEQTVALIRRLSLRPDRPGFLTRGAPELWLALLSRMSAQSDAALTSAWHAIIEILPLDCTAFNDSVVPVLSRLRCLSLFDERLFAYLSTAVANGANTKASLAKEFAALVTECCRDSADAERIASVLAHLALLCPGYPHAAGIAAVLQTHAHGPETLRALSTRRCAALPHIVLPVVRAVCQDPALRERMGAAALQALAASYAVRCDEATQSQLHTALVRLCAVSRRGRPGEEQSDVVSAFVGLVDPASLRSAARKVWKRYSAVADKLALKVRHLLCAGATSDDAGPSDGAKRKRAKREASASDAAQSSCDIQAAADEAIDRAVKGLKYSGAGASPRLQLLLSLLRAVVCAKVVVVADFSAAADVVRDLRRCAKNAEKDPGAVSDALVEVLLMWASRPSVLLRELAQRCFEHALPALVGVCAGDVCAQHWVSSMVRILSTAPQSADQDIMAASEDEECEENLDESELSVGDATPRSNEAEICPADAKTVEHGAAPVESREHSSCGEEEMVDVDDADAAELEMFDRKIAQVFAARRDATQARKMAGRDLMCFKQRVLDWLPGVDAEVHRQGFDVAPLRLALAQAACEIVSLHAPASARRPSSSDRPVRARMALEGELVAKVLATLGKRGHLVPLRVPCDSETVSLAGDDGRRCLSTKDVLEGVGALLRRADSAGCPRFQAGTALFWMLCASRVDAERTPLFWRAAVSLVPQLARRGDAAGQSMLDAFLARLVAASPECAARLLCACWGAFDLARMRPFARQGVLRLAEDVLGRFGRTRVPLDREGFVDLLGCATAYFASLDASAAQPGHVRDELSALCGVLSASRRLLGPGACAAHWAPVLSRLEAECARVPCRGAAQLGALQSRLQSARAMLSNS